MTIENAQYLGLVNPGTSLTYSFTCSGNNRRLYVGVMGAINSLLISGVTYNGVAMTFIDRIQVTSDRWIYLYELINPATGANNIVISASSSTAISGIAIQFAGARQTTAIDNYTKGTANSATSITQSLTPTKDNAHLLMFVKNGAGSAPAAGTGSTLQASGGNLSMFTAGPISPAASTSMQATGTSANWAAIIASIAPIIAATVTTSAASAISYNQATGNGNVTDDGGATVTERGFVLATTSNPTTSDTKFVISGTTGSFSGAMTGLAPLTTYHYRAFATTSEGTVYGADQSFDTIAESRGKLSLLGVG